MPKVKVLRLVVAMVVLISALIALGGCGAPTGDPFRVMEPQQGTPEEAATRWLGSMEFIERNPEKGRDYDNFYYYSDPDLFEGKTLEQLDEERKGFNSKDWAMEFYDLQFDTSYNSEDEAIVRIVGGQVKYGGSIFGSPEPKIDDYRDKPGLLFLRKKTNAKGQLAWVVVGGQPVKDRENYWGEVF